MDFGVGFVFVDGFPVEVEAAGIEASGCREQLVPFAGIALADGGDEALGLDAVGFSQGGELWFRTDLEKEAAERTGCGEARL